MNINYEPNICNFVGYLDDVVTLNTPEEGAKSAKFKLNIIRYFNLKNGGKGKEKTVAEFEIWDSAAEFLAENAISGDWVWISASYKSSGVFRVNRFKILPREKTSV